MLIRNYHLLSIASGLSIIFYSLPHLSRKSLPFFFLFFNANTEVFFFSITHTATWKKLELWEAFTLSSVALVEQTSAVVSWMGCCFSTPVVLPTLYFYDSCAHSNTGDAHESPLLGHRRLVLFPSAVRLLFKLIMSTWIDAADQNFFMAFGNDQFPLGTWACS